MYVGTEIYRTVCDVYFNLNYTNVFGWRANARKFLSAEFRN